jgi:hypothetical protein
MPFKIESRIKGNMQSLTINDGEKTYTLPIDRERFDTEQFSIRVENFQHQANVDEEYTPPTPNAIWRRLMVSYPSGSPLCIFSIEEYRNGARRLLTFQEMTQDTTGSSYNLIINGGYMVACYSLDHLNKLEWQEFLSSLIEKILHP